MRRERRSSVAGETQYAFRHVLVRDVAYGQIPRAAAGREAPARRRVDRVACADRAEDRAEMLAHHYLRALELAGAAGLDDVGPRRPRRARPCATPATGRWR